MRRFLLFLCFWGVFGLQLNAMHQEETFSAEQIGSGIEAKIKSLSTSAYPQNQATAQEIINSYLLLNDEDYHLTKEKEQLEKNIKRLSKDEEFYSKQFNQLPTELIEILNKRNQYFSQLDEYNLSDGTLSDEEMSKCRNIINEINMLAELSKTIEEKYEQAKEKLNLTRVQLENYRRRLDEAFSQIRSCYLKQYQINKAVSMEEIRRISRNLLKNELSGAEKLKNIFGADEVRIIDAKSIIEGLFLSKERKSYYLNLLKNDDIGPNLIEFFNRDLVKFKKGPFVRKSADGKREFFLEDDSSLRKLVQRCSTEDSDKSVVFRNLMIAYMASVETVRPSISIHQIIDQKSADLKKMVQMHLKDTLHMIRRGTDNYYDLSGVVSLNVDQDFYKYSFFKGNGSFAQKLDGRFVYKDENSLGPTIFHEFGHYIFPCIPWEGSATDVMPKLIDITLSDDEKSWALHNNRFPDEEAFKEEPRQPLEIEQLTDEDVVSEHKDRISISLFHDPAEVLQIMGLMLLIDDDKPVLYINKISDFALNAEQGIPIRSDHRGWTDLTKIIQYLQDNRLGIVKIDENESLEVKNEQGTTIHKKYQIPMELYGALFDVFGMSFEGYMSQLMYPKLQPGLQKEFGLSK